MERGAWKAAVHGVAEGRTQLSDFTFFLSYGILVPRPETESTSPVLQGRFLTSGPPGKSSLHARGYWERFIALEPW